jgi:hypothetical protein
MPSKWRNSHTVQIIVAYKMNYECNKYTDVTFCNSDLL